MQSDLDTTIVLRLLLAAGLGAVIGPERGLRRKPAGMRTNMFICMGSAMFTILSEEIGRRMGGDHARVAAQLIPGIGFIGAGAIIRERGSVVGLTTAATIFVVASVGMAAGTGLYWTASFTALLVVLGLSVLGRVEERLIPSVHLVTFRVTTPNLETVMRPAHQIMDEMKVPMQHFQVFHVGSEFLMEFEAEVTAQQRQVVLEKLGAPGARCEVVPVHYSRE